MSGATPADCLRDPIDAFPLDDPGAAVDFSSRLARENGWTRSHTARVVREYRRFLYLCATSGRPMTPSDAVDQAWHLHMCDTRNYWDGLCGGVLGFPLHHGPTRGGAAEREKFVSWYEDTCAAYVETFGERPPADIWPPASERFARRDFRRIDASTHFVVSKSLVTTLGLFLGAGFLLAGCASQLATIDGSALIVVIGLVFVLVVLVRLARGGGKGGGGSSGDGGGGFFGTGGDDPGGDGDSGCGGCGGGD